MLEKASLASSLHAGGVLFIYLFFYLDLFSWITVASDEYLPLLILVIIEYIFFLRWKLILRHTVVPFFKIASTSENRIILFLC